MSSTALNGSIAAKPATPSPDRAALAHIPGDDGFPFIGDTFRFIATRANRQPALAVYRLHPHGQTNAYRGWAVVVLTTDGSVVARIAVFPDPSLMRVFGLPTEL